MTKETLVPVLGVVVPVLGVVVPVLGVVVLVPGVVVLVVALSPPQATSAMVMTRARMSARILFIHLSSYGILSIIHLTAHQGMTNFKSGGRTKKTENRNT